MSTGTGGAGQLSERVYCVFGCRLSSDYAFTRPLIPAEGPPDLSFSVSEGPPLSVPDDALLIYKSQAALDNGDSAFKLYKCQHRYILRFPYFADYEMSRNEILCRLHTKELGSLVEVRLLDLVFALWLEIHGTPTLHAAAVNIAGRAVAFLGPSHVGKSTIAAAMVRSGLPLLTDDLLPISYRNHRFLANSSYPEMRLWPAHAGHFVEDHEQLNTVHPNHSKLRLGFGDSAFGRFWAGPLELSHLCVIERNSRTNREAVTVIKPVSARESVMVLLRNAFMPPIIDKVVNRQKRLGFFSNLASTVPVSRLSYLEGMDYLDQVSAEIVAHLSQHGCAVAYK